MEASWKLEGDRYSPNLRKWMLKNSRVHPNDLFRDRDGTLWIGWIDDGMWFIGSRLWQVLCNGARAQVGCWTFPVSDLTPVDGFWTEYARIGRCAIDTAHDHHFQGERWDENGEVRTCRWCGHKQFRKRWTETVERERWESTVEARVAA